MKEYKSRGGDIQIKPTLGLDITEEDCEDGVGWCLACGTTQDGVEPDAEKMICIDCKRPKVYGLSELFLRGLVDSPEYE